MPKNFVNKLLDVIVKNQLVDTLPPARLELKKGTKQKIVWKDSVSTTRRLDDAVMVQCGNGDMVVYP